MFTNILTLLSFIAALGTAMPTSTVNANTQVRTQTFNEDNCGGAYTFLWLDPNNCVDFAAGVRSLRVVGHDGEIRYNALNVYSASGCNSGPVLQPLSDGCSQVVAYKSIKLSI